jgi:hypothetical protein
MALRLSSSPMATADGGGSLLVVAVFRVPAQHAPDSTGNARHLSLAGHNVVVSAQAHPSVDEVAGDSPCLLCKRVGQVASVEHVFPAGLGSHADVVLPRGAVCVDCNNRLGREVDEALVHLMEVRFIRGLFRVPDHRGRTVDSLDLSNGTITFGPDGSIESTVFGDQHTRTNDAGNLVVTLKSTRRRSGDQWRRVARAVMKLGLNLIYLTYGSEAALDEQFDPLRDAIAGEPYEGYLLIGMFDIYTPPNLEGSLSTDLPGVPLAGALRFGGLHLIAPLSLGPAAPATREWANENSYQVMTIARRRNR